MKRRETGGKRGAASRINPKYLLILLIPVLLLAGDTTDVFTHLAMHFVLSATMGAAFYGNARAAGVAPDVALGIGTGLSLAVGAAKEVFLDHPGSWGDIGEDFLGALSGAVVALAFDQICMAVREKHKSKGIGNPCRAGGTI
jgi:hypothetical protein